MSALLLSLLVLLSPEAALLHLDFKETQPNGYLQFTNSLQFVEATNQVSLDGLTNITIGAWVYPHRAGEQYFFFRGAPQINEWGNRLFPPAKDWVNFVLGTDQRGLFMATANGNSHMPFAHVTVSELAINTWHQLVYVKDGRGSQKFYVDGALAHSDTNSVSAGKFIPFRDKAAGEPIRLAAQMGGRIGEAWIFGRELSAAEIAEDFSAKRSRYNPAFPGKAVLLREMTLHPAANLWPQGISAERWPSMRAEIRSNALKALGAFPTHKVALDPRSEGESDQGSYVRRKISIQVGPGDRMPAYVLAPKNIRGPAPAVICWYGTSGGAGKDSTVGISGRDPGSKPHPNISFALDFVAAGFVAVAPDWLRDGERIKVGRKPYDTTDFYQDFPDWSAHGKDIWDTSRLVDYLETVDLIDAERIGIAGHSYGGHSAIFTAAFEPRIKAVVANGPVSDFIQHGAHWGVPKGAGNSQSLPSFRPYVLERSLPPPIAFYEFTSLIAPRPLLVGQAAGEHRPMEEENAAAVSAVYRALGAADRVRYHWYAGDHDFPPEARAAAIEFFRKHLNAP